MAEFNVVFTPIGTKDRAYYNLNLDPKLVLQFSVPKKKKFDKINSPKWKKHYEAFIKIYDLKKGTLAIRTNVLYQLYDKWRWNSHQPSILGIDMFRRFMHLYFAHKVNAQDKYFLIDHSILNHLTEEQKLQCLSPKGQKHALKKEENKKKSS